MAAEATSLTDEKLRAEVAKLIEETRRLGVDAEKSRAETGQIKVSMFLAPFAAAAALMGATAAVVKVFFS